jgi:hypothetical protein
VIAALWFVWRNGRLDGTLLVNCFIQSARTTGMVILVIVCALLLNVTLSMTGATPAESSSVIVMACFNDLALDALREAVAFRSSAPSKPA